HAPPASAHRRLCPAPSSVTGEGRAHRRRCQQLLRHQHVKVSLSSPAVVSSGKAEVILSRAQRAHYRLALQERLARNARVSTAGQVTIKLFGVPESFASSLGLGTA